MNRLLHSIESSRVGGDQFAAYMLRPCNSPTSSTPVTTSSNSAPETNERDLNTELSTTTSSSLISPEFREDLNVNPTSSGGASVSTSTTETDSADGSNQDYRGVYAIFRARDNNSWNFQVTSDVSDSNGERLEPEATTNSVTFETTSTEASSGVSISLSANDTQMFPDTDSVTLPEPSVNSGGMEAPVPFSSRYLSSVSDEAMSSSDRLNREPSDRVVGVGRVINVEPRSSRTSYLSHGSNHSSSFATLGGSQGSGTAVATATARTFRHVHTAVVVADGTNGGPQFALRTAINRAIAGAFAGCGEGAVASNIINTTHRLQWWDFSQVKLPDLKNSK